MSWFMMKQLGKQFVQLHFSRYACVRIFILSSVAMDTVIYSYQVSSIPLLAMIFGSQILFWHFSVAFSYMSNSLIF